VGALRELTTPCFIGWLEKERSLKGRSIMVSRLMARKVEQILDAADLDELVLGVFEVDKSGKILRYISATCGPIRGHGLRAREARLARTLGCTTEEGDTTTSRDPAEMLGKNYFKEVAPSEFAEELEGLFRKGVETGNLDIRLAYAIDHGMDRIQVRVRMERAPQADEQWASYWIIVKRV
jgi:photoactive yellow protein